MKFRSGDQVYDSNKPEKPFDDYTVDHKLSIMDTHKTKKQGFTSHKYLARFFKNPLYFKNCFQYLFGGFYQAVHGILKTTGRLEEKLASQDLVDYLNKLERDGKYWVKTFEMLRKSNIMGVAWVSCNTAKPRGPRFKRKSFLVFKGDIIYVRRDATDNPFIYHVEMYDRAARKHVVVDISADDYEKLMKRVREYGGDDPLPKFNNSYGVNRL